MPRASDVCGSPGREVAVRHRAATLPWGFAASLGARQAGRAAAFHRAAPARAHPFRQVSKACCLPPRLSIVQNIRLKECSNAAVYPHLFRERVLATHPSATRGARSAAPARGFKLFTYRLDMAKSGSDRRSALIGDRFRRHSTCLKTKQALVPPKPKEFESTNSTSRLFALCGTRSISVAIDKLSRFRVGGTI